MVYTSRVCLSVCMQTCMHACVCIRAYGLYACVLANAYTIHAYIPYLYSIVTVVKGHGSAKRA
jgi:hypothetical protein